MALAYGIDTSNLSTMRDLYDLLRARQQSRQEAGSTEFEADGEALTLRLGTRRTDAVFGGSHRDPPEPDVDDPDAWTTAADEPGSGTRATAAAQLDQTEEQMQEIAADYTLTIRREPTELERWMMGRLRSLLDRSRVGDLDALEALARMYDAAVGWPPEREWERLLRIHVERALQHRQSKPATKSGRRGMTTGAAIALTLTLQCPRETVPEALTGDRIERILQTATLKAVGAQKRRRPNYNDAIDTLVRELGFEPYRTG
jgi:hypothetical protein